MLGRNMALSSNALHASPVHFRPARHEIHRGDHDNLNVGLSLGYEIINGLSVPIVIATRDGLKYTLPPAYGAHGNVLTIISNRRWAHNGECRTDELYDSKDPEAKTILDSIVATISGSVGRYRQAAVRTEISLNDFRGSGDTLYLQTLDLVISTLRPDRVLHPHSARGRELAQIRDTPGAGLQEAASLVIRIVDNHNRFGSKYMNLNGEVFCVPAAVEPNMEDGVYVIRSGISEGAQSTQEPSVTRYEFTEAQESLGLYDTVHEARSLGNTEKQLEAQHQLELKRVRNDELELKNHKLRLERELHNVQQELQLSKQRYEEAKNAYDQDLMGQKRETERLNHELNMASMRRKDYYEERSHDRKDGSEMLKYLPVVIAGIGALFLSLKK